MASASEREFPKTEEGLQKLLEMLSQARAAKNRAEEARLLLELAFLVKWVRSDNGDHPLPRAVALSKEALDIYRDLGDVPGQVAALISSSASFDHSEAASMLEEADRLAKGFGDDLLSAKVLARRAVLMGFQEGAKEMSLQALDTFERLGYKPGIGRVCFTLTITEKRRNLSRNYAMRSRRAFRDAGLIDDSIRSILVAGMHKLTKADLVIEPEVQEALLDAKALGDSGFQSSCYNKLARLALVRGDGTAALEFYRRFNELREWTDYSELEKWESEVDSAKVMVKASKNLADQTAYTEFSALLSQAKARKPRKSRPKRPSSEL